MKLVHLEISVWVNNYTSCSNCIQCMYMYLAEICRVTSEDSGEPHNLCGKQCGYDPAQAWHIAQMTSQDVTTERVHLKYWTWRTQVTFNYLHSDFPLIVIVTLWDLPIFVRTVIRVARNVRQLSSIGISCSLSRNELWYISWGAKLIHSIMWKLHTKLTTINHHSTDGCMFSTTNRNVSRTLLSLPSNHGELLEVFSSQMLLWTVKLF